MSFLKCFQFGRENQKRQLKRLKRVHAARVPHTLVSCARNLIRAVVVAIPWLIGENTRKSEPNGNHNAGTIQISELSLGDHLTQFDLHREAVLPGLKRPVQHCVERQGGTPTTAREAGTPARLVRSNALLGGPLMWGLIIGLTPWPDSQPRRTARRVAQQLHRVALLHLENAWGDPGAWRSAPR